MSSPAKQSVVERKAPTPISLQGPPVASLADGMMVDNEALNRGQVPSTTHQGSSRVSASATRKGAPASPLSSSTAERSDFHTPNTDVGLEIRTNLANYDTGRARLDGSGRYVSPTLASLAASGGDVPTVTQNPELMRNAPAPHASSFYDPDNWMQHFKALRSSTVKSKDLVTVGHKTKAVITTKSAVRSACIVRVLPSLDSIKAALRKAVKDKRRQRYDMWESATTPGRRDRSVYSNYYNNGDYFQEGGKANVSPGSSPSRSSQSRGLSGRLSHSHSQQQHARAGASSRDAATKLYMTPPAVWAIGGVNDSEVNVYEAFSGRPLMRIRDPKANVPAVSLLHAPYRGFMNRQLKVLSIHEPSDLLRIKSSQLIETDWVWVGFTDGCIRLFPANPARIRESDRAEQFSKGELADLVFELPKYHSASIVSIVRSPCHRDDDGADLSTLNRLSTAVQYMTAACAENSDKSREHLSLMCTASVDSSIVIWDVRKIYQTLEAMRIAKKEALSGSCGTSVSGGVGGGGGMNTSRMSVSGRGSTYFAGSVYANETITLEGFSTPGSGESGAGAGAAFTVRSSCTLIKVRPLMRLKGGVASLKTLQWVSTLVTTEDYVKRRNEAEMTRDTEEPSAPKLIRGRRASQALTRFDRREEHRLTLGLSEEDMREVEDELRHLMPPVAKEPVQSLRVNLIVASDNVGTVHLWNLDEELTRKMNDPFNDLAGAAMDSGRRTPRQRSPRTGRSAASESPGRSSVGVCSVVSPSVQLSAIDGPASHSNAVLRRQQQDRQTQESESRPAAGDDSRTVATAASKTVAKSPGAVKRKKAAATTLATRPTLSGPTSKHAQRGTAAAASPPRTPGKRTGAAASKASALEGTVTKTAKKSARGAASVQRPQLPPLSLHGQHSNAGHAATSSRAPSGRAGTVDRAGLAATAADSAHGEASMSKLQVIAAHRDDRHTPIREMNRVMETPTPGLTGRGDSAEVERSGRRSLSLTQPSAHSARRRTAKKTTSRPRAHEGGCGDDADDREPLTVSRSPQPSGEAAEDVSVNSPPRRLKSPSLPAGTPSAMTPPPRSSPSRLRGMSMDSPSQQRALNDYLSRASRCRIEFTGGAGINGMAVDVPPRLGITLRRLPDPEERLISLLEEPTPEEVERRVLENSFETLTEEKALFFVFQQLQMYLAVEGTVLNLRSVPVWNLPDDDARDLFAQRGERESERTVARQQLHKETVVAGSVELTPAFSIHLRKLVLETHSQPVTELFLDHSRGHIWVARNDGLLSLFSKHTKKIVTRVPHPLADAALGPPNQKEWRTQQRELVKEFTSGAPLRLEWHKECRGYDAAHFSELVPFGRRTQVALLMTANVVTTTPPVHQGDDSLRAHRLDSFADLLSTTTGSTLQTPFFESLADSTFTPSRQLQRQQQHQLQLQQRSQQWAPSATRSPVPYALSSLMRLTSNYLLNGERVSKSLAAVIINGCSDLNANAKRREERFGTLLNQMLLCRGNADVVRRAQKAYYEALCETIGSNVRYVINEIGTYTSLSMTHRSYDLWRQHAAHYPRPHIMRTQRAERLARSHGAASAMGRVVQMRLARTAFRSWCIWAAEKKERSTFASLTKLFKPLRQEEEHRMRTFTAAMFLHLLRTQQRCVVYDGWRAWAHAKRLESVAAARRRHETAADGRRAKSLSFSPSPGGDWTPNGDAGTMPAVLNSPVHGINGQDSQSSSSALSPPPAHNANTMGPDGLDPLSLSGPGKHSSPGDSPRAVSPLVRTFTRRYRTSASPMNKNGAPPQRPLHPASFSSDSDSAEDDEADGRLNTGFHEANVAPPVDDDAERKAQAALVKAHPFLRDFLDMLRQLYAARPAIMLFRESLNFDNSVLDESWMSIVESAEGAADTDDEQGRRLGVFSFGLLPLLQGLLSTAEDVLPNLHEVSVAEEVLSMLNGVQLCMDYVAADADDALMCSLHRRADDGAQLPTDADGTTAATAAQREVWNKQQHTDAFTSSPEKRYLKLLATYMFKAVDDADSQQAMKEISAEKDSLEAFIAFVEDDRFNCRRHASVPLH